MEKFDKNPRAKTEESIKDSINIPKKNSTFKKDPKTKSSSSDLNSSVISNNLPFKRFFQIMVFKGRSYFNFFDSLKNKFLKSTFFNPFLVLMIDIPALYTCLGMFVVNFSPFKDIFLNFSFNHNYFLVTLKPFLNYYVSFLIVDIHISVVFYVLLKLFSIILFSILQNPVKIFIKRNFSILKQKVNISSWYSIKNYFIKIDSSIINLVNKGMKSTIGCNIFLYFLAVRFLLFIQFEFFWLYFGYTRKNIVNLTLYKNLIIIFIEPVSIYLRFTVRNFIKKYRTVDSLCFLFLAFSLFFTGFFSITFFGNPHYHLKLYERIRNCFYFSYKFIYFLTFASFETLRLNIFGTISIINYFYGFFDVRPINSGIDKVPFFAKVNSLFLSIFKTLLFSKKEFLLYLVTFMSILFYYVKIICFLDANELYKKSLKPSEKFILDYVSLIVTQFTGLCSKALSLIVPFNFFYIMVFDFLIFFLFRYLIKGCKIPVKDNHFTSKTKNHKHHSHGSSSKSFLRTIFSVITYIINNFSSEGSLISLLLLNYIFIFSARFIEVQIVDIAKIDHIKKNVLSYKEYCLKELNNSIFGTFTSVAILLFFFSLFMFVNYFYSSNKLKNKRKVHLGLFLNLLYPFLLGLNNIVFRNNLFLRDNLQHKIFYGLRLAVKDLFFLSLEYDTRYFIKCDFSDLILEPIIKLLILKYLHVLKIFWIVPAGYFTATIISTFIIYSVKEYLYEDEKGHIKKAISII